jgi:hypothetical protein
MAPYYAGHRHSISCCRECPADYATRAACGHAPLRLLRAIVGIATFFDAYTVLAIAFAMPQAAYRSFHPTVAQLEASIADVNLILRHRAAGNGTALRKLATKEDVMNENEHTGFDAADIAPLSHLYRGEHGVADPA